MLVLDSGGLTRLCERTTRALGLIRALRSAELWPPVVPSMVLVESLRGHPGHYANTHRFLKTCVIETHVPVELAKRAAELRHRSRHGSAVDALVVAYAEPGGTVLTGDPGDIEALAAFAEDVVIERV